MTTPTHDCYGFPFTAPMIGHFALTPAEAVLVQQLFDAGRLRNGKHLTTLEQAMGALAWHRENVGKASQPELELEMPQ